jgi:lipopolysaccharide export LptBFGC system permease protein LptF
LREYLANNAHFADNRLAVYRTQLAYRWALPWGCFLAVLIAAPLGIIYSRRGLMGSITVAILLFFLLVLASSVFLALGKGARIDPILAAWGPLVLFGAIGLLMLWMRSTNREVPNILS